MAIPTPRSFQQILSDMIDSVTSEYGIESLRVGGPILSVFEAAAQSDLRNTQDVFSLLSATDLERCNGIALDRIGLDENVVRFQESPASGYVTISDSSFDKVSSTLYQGAPAPIAGSLTIYVRSAAVPPWTMAGTLYIGRGTTNYEGPLTYDSILLAGNYYEITLNAATPTTRFHNVGESVVMSQGGTRTIAAGTIVQTTSSSAVEATTFSVTYGAILPEGETSIENVLVTASTPGVSGNVSAGQINQFSTLPFVGAEVTNPLPFTNALATESDDLYRERIKIAKQTRAKGTVIAIKNGVLGIVAADENKRVVSSSLVTRPGEAAVLYVDDGSGYEERDLGVAFETLMESASGGEQYFQLRGSRPVAKARLISSISAPFNFGTDIDAMNTRNYVAKLAVSVGGVVTEHIFEVTDFVSPSNASAYEIVASINANPLIDFIARTTDSGTRVVILARADVGEDIQVAASTAILDANDILVFSPIKNETLKLYKNNELLVKDGYVARLYSRTKTDWAIIPGAQTIRVSVDGTPEVTYTVQNSDFVDAGTGYVTITNALPASAWATVFNYIIPGITATVESGLLVLTSNLGTDDRAGISIVSGSLVTAYMFDAGEAVGKTSDYELDRNLGQIKLLVPLAAGDSLTAGSEDTRAFIETPAFTTLTPAASDFWFIVDAPVALVNHNVVSTTPLDVTVAAFGAGPFGQLVTVTDNTGGSTVFADVAVGDWVIFWDDALEAADVAGAWRVSASAANSITYECGDPAVPAAVAGLYALDAGISFARSTGIVHKASLAGAIAMTPSDVVTAFVSLDDSIDIWETDNKVRFSTRGFGTDASIALVAQDVPARALGLTVGDSSASNDSHRASIQSLNCLGMPVSSSICVGITGLYTAVDTELSGPSIYPLDNSYIVGKQVLYTGDVRYGTNKGFFSPVEVIGAGITTRWSAPQAWTPCDEYAMVSPISLSAYDALNVLVDGDTQTKNYDINMFRNVVPADANYSDDILLNDNDNQVLGVPQGLEKSFGNGFDFADFALFMHARVKSHPGDNHSTMLWRAKDFGLDGEALNIMYQYPLAADQPTAFNVRKFADEYDGLSAMSDVEIVLPSGSERTMSLRNPMRIGISREVVAGSGICKTFVIFGLAVLEATSDGVHTTLKLALPAGVTDDPALGTVYGLSTGQFVHYNGFAGFAAGNYTISSVDKVNSTITYASADPAGGPVPTLGTYVTTDSLNGSGVDYDLPGTFIMDGDIAYVSDYCGLPSFSDEVRDYYASGRVGDTAVYSFSVTVNNGAPFAAAVPIHWWELWDKDALKVFPLDPTAWGIDTIAHDINLMDDCPVTAVAVSDGVLPLVYNGIWLATWDQLSDYQARYPMTDGLRFVQTTAQPGTYQLLLKNVTLAASLKLNADWENEELRLVPVTNTNFIDYMGCLGVTGLSSSADLSLSDDKHKIQITSTSLGSDSGIMVQSGEANSFLISALGSPDANLTPGSTTLAVPIRASDAEHLDARQWVKFLNSSGGQKLPTFTAAQTVQITNIPAGAFPATIRLTGAENWFTASACLSADPLLVERVGKLMCYIADAGLMTLPTVGSWVWVYSASLSAANCGFFRVVSTSANMNFDAFFVENDSGVDESVASCNITSFTANSILPGDTININTSVWGVALHHTWTVASIGGDNMGDEANWAFANSLLIDLVPDYAATNTFAPSAAIGTSLSLVRTTEGINAGWIKQILAVVPDNDPAKAWIKLASGFNSTVYVGAGTTITAMERLGFSADLIEGMDGYKYSTGLIREANKVVYGDERDPIVYPGIAAAGANINIQGPLVKRVSVSLELRVRTGLSKLDIANKVRSAVAAAINKIGVGESIAISDVVSAAGGVNGVTAVTVTSPEYATGHDLISVQAHEKPMVLDSNQDVLVAFVGD